MQISVAPNSTASSTRRTNSSSPCSYASGDRLPCPKPQKAQPTTQMFDTLMLRLTTNVTSSPATSRAQLVGRLAHVLDRLRPRLGEHRGELLRVEPIARASPLDRGRHQVAPDHAIRAPARPAPRDEAPVLQLDHVEHALLEPVRSPCTAGTRTAARSARSPSAGAASASCAATGTDARARCGPRSRTARPGRSPLPRPAGATSPRGWGGFGCLRRASGASLHGPARACLRA